MYAVIKSGGKQYKVQPNDVLKLEKIAGEEGQNIKLDNIIAIGDEKGVNVGDPILKDASVGAEILKQGKDKKVIIFKKKRRHNYRRKNGHRQQITVVRITDITEKGKKLAGIEAKKKAAPKKEEAKAQPEEKKTEAKTETKEESK